MAYLHRKRFDAIFGQGGSSPGEVPSQTALITWVGPLGCRRRSDALRVGGRRNVPLSISPRDKDQPINAPAWERLSTTKEGLSEPMVSVISGALSTAVEAFIPIIPFFFLDGIRRHRASLNINLSTRSNQTQKENNEHDRTHGDVEGVVLASKANHTQNYSCHGGRDQQEKAQLNHAVGREVHGSLNDSKDGSKSGITRLKMGIVRDRAE